MTTEKTADEGLGAVRKEGLKVLATGLWDGTGEILAQIADESRWAHGWRPIRTAAALASAEMMPRVWMHPHEFKAWRAAAKATARKFDRCKPEEDLGISQPHAADLSRQDRCEKRNLRIPKILALACAHYALGLEKPQVQTLEEFRDFYDARFAGGTKRVAPALDVSVTYLTDRIAGDKKPFDGTDLRAMDWLYKFGPVCPYGDLSIATLPVWPGQTPTA